MPGLRSVRLARNTRDIKNIEAPRQPILSRKYRLPHPPLNTRWLPSYESEVLRERQERMEPLENIPGGVATDLERIVYKELKKLGYGPPDMDFQSSMLGGRMGWQFGRQIADFVIYSLGLVIEVQGEYWHSPVEQQNRDAERVMRLMSLPRRNVPWHVEYLEEWVVAQPYELDRWMQRNVVNAGMRAERAY